MGVMTWNGKACVLIADLTTSRLRMMTEPVGGTMTKDGSVSIGAVGSATGPLIQRARYK